MDAKTMGLVEKFKKNQELAQKIMSGSDGQRLMQLLTSQDGGAALQQAAQKAESGDTKALAQLLGSLMKSPEGAALMQRLNESAKK
mgnify:FL=1